ncbi:MAG: SagB/ThcOx family dehydrogenase [bacterium]|nr:SagB/ThcOx family dehydrogenase [bacterium]
MCIFIFLLLLKGGETMEIKLPAPVLKGKVSVEECIAKRRSIRAYLDKPISLEQLSQLFWASQGITDLTGLRAAPSAGATYPIEVRAVTKDGVFHYIPEGHKLIKESDKDLRKKLAQAALWQSFIAEAGCNFVISCVYKRTTQRYGDRGIRYVHMEAGHVAENIHLQAVALGLGSVPVGAFYDEEVKKVLNLPKDEDPIYIITVGYPK